MKTVILHSRTSPQASPAMLEDMYRLRCRIFKERLRWDIACKNGMDYDDFDRLHPVYALYCPNRPHVEGCARMLPTTGPNMLSDIFPFLVEDGTPPVADDIWETSRFAVDTLTPKYESLAGLHNATSALVIELVEFGMRNHIRRIVAAMDVRFERILYRCGANVRRLGKIKRIGESLAVAGYFDVTAEAIDRLHLVAEQNFAKQTLENEKVAA